MRKPAPQPPPHRLVIEAGKTEGRYWRDLWRYRELCYFLAWRDILVRYKQTILGIAWTLIRPALLMAIFTLVFSRMANLSSGGAPYPLLVMAGLLPWQFFANAITEAASSLINNDNLVSKVYFPRMLVPASSTITALVDLLISLVLMAGLMIWYNYPISWHLLLLPGFLLMALGCSLGVGLWLSALNVKFRDFRYVIPFFVQFGLYASPVGFTTNAMPEQLRFVLMANPMTGVIDGFRWALLGENYIPDATTMVIACTSITVLLATGLIFFRKTERSFADII